MWTNTVHCRMHVWVPAVDQALIVRVASGGNTDLLANEQGKLINGNNGKLGLHLRHVLIWTLLNLGPVVKGNTYLQWYHDACMFAATCGLSNMSLGTCT